MFYTSTRGDKNKISSSEAIIKGICEDGGLYVPDFFPNLSKELINLLDLNYSKIAFYILSKFLVDFSEKDLMDCINKAYDNKFDTQLIAPIKKVNNSYFLELYHGPTLAFKDIALTLMPHLLNISLQKKNIEKDILILTATSGDTGKAALEGFKDVEKVKIAVFFPEDGVSPIQKLQMKTQDGNNTYVCGIDGNFDDAQSGVKEIFNNNKYNQELNDKGYLLSSANSINIGRLLPQIVYYFSSYLKLVKTGEIKLFDKVNFVVPTGNFGNILAGYYALKMGLPINKLICASNENNVLCDFFKTGVYNKNRKLKLTNSPSMDILISSNLERLLFEISNKDNELIKSLFYDLSSKGSYDTNDLIRNNLSSFYSDYSTVEEVNSTIKKVYTKYNYLIDTHTAVAYNCYEKYTSSTGDDTKTIILSTASPFKFPKDVLDSIKDDLNANNNKRLYNDEFQIIDELSKFTNLDIPTQIKDLKYKDIIHNDKINKYQLNLAIDSFILKNT